MSDQTTTVVVEWPRPEVAVLRLNRPKHLNALTSPIVLEIIKTVNDLAARDDCRVLVVTGEGRGFCAGLDLIDNANNPQDERSIPNIYRVQRQFAEIVRSFRSMRQPVIAAVNGAAAGAGFAMALGCDIRLATPLATFHVGAIKVGLSAGECGISYHLPRVIGSARAFEIMLTGRPVTAAEGERIGLVARVVPDQDLMATALAIATSIVANSPFGVAMTKSIMWQNLDADSLDKALELENRTQALTFLTRDSREAMQAFTEKRPPFFIGE